MKLLLFRDTFALNPSTTIEFMKKKGLEHYLYVFDKSERRYVRKPVEDIHSERGKNIVSVKDFGELFPNDLSRINDFIYRPSYSKIRYDKELIELVESEPKKFNDVKVVDVEDGTRFKIMTNDQKAEEYIEVFDETKWLTAGDIPESK